MKKYLQKGFTLVELLIVIALIAILSVAVLATINPIEQSNKARDAKVQNDAAEVMNAYERYYAGKSSYPWLDVVVGTMTVDSPFYSRSSQVGFALCSTTAVIASPNEACESSTTPGLIITTQELKNSFLNKGYTTMQSDPGWNYVNELFLIKQAAVDGNSIYVCYVPKANANRQNSVGSNSKLMALTVTGTSNADGLPTTFEPATEEQILAATYESLLDNDTLFRCVPE
jgi:prepilin-type N-terminal cleavage/methylation domain-containing protein